MEKRGCSSGRDERPRISVVMGVYYRREDTALLRRSIDSIRAQEESHWELLICDDGSSDEAKSLLDAYAREDKRITLIRPGGAYGLAQKLNCCLQEARGEYIARMDDDDYAYPNRLSRQLRVLARRRDVAFAGSNVGLICEGRCVGQWTLPPEPTVQDFYIRQPFVHPALLFRKACLKAVCGYSEEKRCLLCEDYDLLLRLYRAGYRGINIQEILLDYTIPASGKGSRTMRHRWNETVTRWKRFKELGVLAAAWPYTLKPLATGLLPEPMLRTIKARQRRNKEKDH